MFVSKSISIFHLPSPCTYFLPSFTTTSQPWDYFLIPSYHLHSQPPPPLSALFLSPVKIWIQNVVSTCTEHCDKVTNDHLQTATQYIIAQKI